jgi:hypothetical protein
MSVTGIIGGILPQPYRNLSVALLLIRTTSDSTTTAMRPARESSGSPGAGHARWHAEPPACVSKCGGGCLGSGGSAPRALRTHLEAEDGAR